MKLRNYVVDTTVFNQVERQFCEWNFSHIEIPLRFDVAKGDVVRLQCGSKKRARTQHVTINEVYTRDNTHFTTICRAHKPIGSLGLVIKEPWVDLILDGEKTLEIRGNRTLRRGTIKLIKSGSGLIVGTVDIVDVYELDKAFFDELRPLHCIQQDFTTLPYPKAFGWCLENPVRYENPIPYKHPLGAVIWVKL
jgi:hypothetical protein